MRAIAGPFIASRAIVLALLILFGNLTLVRMSFGFVKETRITLASAPLVDVFSAGDAKWFRIVAEEGYVRAPFHKGMQENWAFFPLFPMATRYLRVLPSYALNATILTHLFFLGVLWMLYALAKRAGCDDEVARRAIGYAAFFPSSYFFSLPMAESLFVLLAAGCCVAAFADRWLLAGLLGCLASATRVQGVLLIAFLIVLCWQRKRGWYSILLVPCGLASFCVFLWRITGNPFAFADIQSEWQRSAGLSFAQYALFFRELPIVSAEWNFRALNVLMLFFLLIAIVLLLRQRQAALAAFVAASFVVVLLSGSLQSIGRYVLSTFPVFIALASVRWSERTHALLQSVFAVVLGALTLLYALHYDIGMT
jgi:Gpi18-like mannosyltransferase